MMALIDFILHVDQHLIAFVQHYGAWVYLLLFLIVFVETGLVVMPFLPGDSLLFAAGALSATGAMHPGALMGLLFVAAVLGDNVNYLVGRRTGQAVFDRDSRWIRREYLQRTQAFFDRHGGKSVILARFVPIVRTFAPFLAGVGAMPYGVFFLYNLIGGALWIGGFVFLGYHFGNLPAVKHNFSLVIFLIIGISLVPMVVEFWRHRRQARLGAG
jgi:membrane-associated protein